MSETRFTPGPWRYWPCRVDSNANPPMYDFVQFANQHDHVFRAPLKYLSEADARLIAAAPDLYRALELALPHIHKLTYPEAKADYSDMRYALQKARGES